MQKNKFNSKSFVLVFAALLSAFGPFMTDFYLPAFPELKEYFGSSISLVQLSLTFGMIGLAGGQLLIGPLSDKYGRRRPLIISLSVFILATAARLFCNRVEWFIFFRLIQGIAAAGGVVISRSVAADLYQGKEFTRFFAMLSAVQGLAPIIAPVAGGVLLEATNWKGIFLALLLLGAGILLTAFRFRESLSVEKRKTGNVFSAFTHFGKILKNKRFTYYMLIQSFAMAVLFAYISSSPFIFQSHYGIGTVAYSCIFACNAISIVMGNLIVARFGTEKKALLFGSVFLLIMAVMLAGGLFRNFSVIYIEISLFLLLFGVGMVLPTATSLALGLEKENAGNASALLGFLQFLFAGLVAPMVGLGDMLYSTAFIVLTGSVVTVMLVLRIRMNDKRFFNYNMTK